MGKNKTPMAELRKVLTQDGFGNARTYIASGNALVDSDLPAFKVERRIHALIKEHIGPNLKVFVRTADQLRAVLDGNPFKEGYDISRVFFTLFQEPLPKEKVDELVKQDFSPEKLVISEEAAYLYIPGSAARSKLSNVWLEKQLGVAATTRNFNTVLKLIAMCNEGGKN